MKKDKTPTGPSIKDIVATRIVNKCVLAQERWAACMQRIFERFSLTGKKFLLACMCILSGGYSIFLIAENLIKHNKKNFIVTPIKMPAHVLENKNFQSITNLIPETEYKKIERFKKCMDSLQQTKDGKKKYDSILQSRPRLLDSVITIEKIYQQQKK